MHEDMMTIAYQLGLVTLLAFIGSFMLRQKMSIKWLVIALSLYFINDVMLTRGFGEFPRLMMTNWNWEGKLYALVVTLYIASRPEFGWKHVGITWSQGKEPFPAYSLLFILACFFFGLAYFDNTSQGDIETVLFQWTMPGLEEEAFYRGTLLVAMNEAFKNKINILGANIGYGGFLTCCLFGFGHAASYASEGLTFDVFTFMVTAIPSFLLLWMRERTGSIVLPIVGHNIANGAVTLY
jgi:hypothetical protein